MKMKKTRRRKRKLLLTGEMEVIEPERVIRSEEAESIADDFIKDTMPTRAAYREQLEIGIRNRVLVLLQVSFLCYIHYQAL